MTARPSSSSGSASTPNQDGVALTVTLTGDQLDAIAERVAVLLSERQAPRDERRYLNAVEAAWYLSCSRGRLYDLVQLRKLEPCRDGRRLLFRRSVLDAYLDGSA